MPHIIGLSVGLPVSGITVKVVDEFLLINFPAELGLWTRKGWLDFVGDLYAASAVLLRCLYHFEVASHLHSALTPTKMLHTAIKRLIYRLSCLIILSFYWINQDLHIIIIIIMHEFHGNTSVIWSIHFLCHCEGALYMTARRDLRLCAPSEDHLSPFSSVLCCCLHLLSAVPKTHCPHFFLQISFPGLPCTRFSFVALQWSIVVLACFTNMQWN